MGLLQRLKYSIEADLHQFFDKKEKKNPIAMLNQYIREAEKQTEETGKYLERQSQLKYKLEKEFVYATEMVEKRQNQLTLAQASGELDLVEFAQDEVTAYVTRQTALSASIEQVTQELFNLERKYEEMKHKIKDMKVRQLQLMGKENVVRANTEMDRVLSPESRNKHNERLDTFEVMENYIDNLGKKIDHEHEITSMEERLALLEKKDVPMNKSID
ncbi:PspA/IM30 family protein [Kurthia sibirica]|uniref:Modulator protein n=1 Tax=Kurthia sibirica TaxID=202750 RepID=A0A2U3APY4_9BACL|nr:PspA/IM30 family protein [Kurthia sibirica]PWI26584.1 hypothetical protein DEX24_02130 [Kurthia sibirica]GEK32836.1 phage shock protein A [Kurthia sibirica]